jgi:signal peptidase II
MQRIFLVLAVALLAFLVDQASKWAILTIVMQPPRIIPILPVFNLTLGFNTGVSFGMFSETLVNWPGTLSLVKLAISAGLLLWAVLSPSLLERTGLAMIAGGALGNIYDRLQQGAVTDFLDFYWGNWHFPTFNMADVAISLGVALILFAALLSPKTVAKVESQ